MNNEVINRKELDFYKWLLGSLLALFLTGSGVWLNWYMNRFDSSMQDLTAQIKQMVDNQSETNAQIRELSVRLSAFERRIDESSSSITVITNRLNGIDVKLERHAEMFKQMDRLIDERCK